MKHSLFLPVFCTLFLAAAAPGQASNGFSVDQVRGSANYVTDGIFGIDLGVEVLPPWQDLTLTGGLTWWNHSEDIPGGDISFRDIGLLGGLRHHFPAEESLHPYVDAGLGIHLMKISDDTTDASNTDAKLGLYLGAGVAYDWSRELQFYSQVRIHLTDPDFSTLAFGAAYRLGR